MDLLITPRNGNAQLAVKHANKPPKPIKDRPKPDKLNAAKEQKHAAK